MRKTKILAALFAIAVSGFSAAFAENSASQKLQAILPSYVDIKAEVDTQQKTIDPQTGNLESGFSSVFTINSNDDLKLYLTAKADTDRGFTPAFYSKGDQVYIILTHTTYKPTGMSIEDIKSGSATPKYNPNAIAYPVSGVNVDGKIVDKPVYRAEKQQYEFSVQQGTSTATATISPSVDPTTYSFDDRAGTYEAYITLTDTTT